MRPLFFFSAGFWRSNSAVMKNLIYSISILSSISIEKNLSLLEKRFVDDDWKRMLTGKFLLPTLGHGLMRLISGWSSTWKILRFDLVNFGGSWSWLRCGGILSFWKCRQLFKTAPWSSITMCLYRLYFGWVTSLDVAPPG